jgi:uncharacterized protein YdbL (DUF1318 family)
MLAQMPSGSVKVSFFGGMTFGRVKDAVETIDGKLLVASLDDLMATKLKAVLDRAEAKDYQDIARMNDARDRVAELPAIALKSGSLAGS